MHKFNLDISEKSEWITAMPVSNKILPFYISEIGRFLAGMDYYTERADTESYILIYTISGRGEMETDGMRFIMKRGDCMLLDCRNHHVYKSDTNQWDFFWVHIDGAAIGAIERELNGGGASCIHIQNCSKFENLFEELLRKAKFNDIRILSEISLTLHELLNLLLESNLGITDDTGEGGHISDIKNVLKYIRENYGRQINIADLIAEVHLSQYYFIRLFKRYMGTTPYNYLMNYRINQAKIFLRSTDMSIAEIAKRTGFLDSSNFIANFKKQTNQKPTEYRKDFYY